MAKRGNLRRYLLDAELAAFMGAVSSRVHVNAKRDRAFFALLANTGIRPSEALAIVRGDVSLSKSESTIMVRRLKSRLNAPADILVLTPALSDTIRERVQEMGADPLARLFPICERQAQRVFHYYARKAGIARRTRLYILRHTAATRMYRSTRDIALVQAMLGHRSPDTTAIYAHITRSILQETAAVVGSV